MEKKSLATNALGADMSQPLLPKPHLRNKYQGRRGSQALLRTLSQRRKTLNLKPFRSQRESSPLSFQRTYDNSQLIKKRILWKDVNIKKKNDKKRSLS